MKIKYIIDELKIINKKLSTNQYKFLVIIQWRT